MKASSLRFSVISGASMLLVLGCTPYIRVTKSSPANPNISVNRHIIYDVPPQFKITHDKQDEVTVRYKADREFGLHFDVPRVGYDKTKEVPENIAVMIPVLKKDIEREGRKEVKDITQTFGKNCFYGFSYMERDHHREVLDGVIVVGKSYIISQIYYPLESDEAKYPGVRKSISLIAENMVHE